MSELASGWIFPLRRKDGMIIRYRPQTKDYEVVTNDSNRPDITSCPCCDKPLKSVRACQLVCNGVYPLKEVSP